MKKAQLAFLTAISIIGMASCGTSGKTIDTAAVTSAESSFSVVEDSSQSEPSAAEETAADTAWDEPIDENTYFNSCYLVHLDPEKWQSTAEYKDKLEKRVEYYSGGKVTAEDCAGDIMFNYAVPCEDGKIPNIVFSEPVYYEKYKDNTVADIKDKVLRDIKSDCSEMGLTFESDEMVKIANIDCLKTVVTVSLGDNHVKTEQYLFLYKGNMCSIVVASAGSEEAAADAMKVIENIKLK
ncbi:MAG: hypothetical protein K6B74_08890 [Ruminococcus sp.]|nr:hypothetical protein [Ruminococcus sp.]